jgi:hypothetical protein
MADPLIALLLAAPVVATALLAAAAVCPRPLAGYVLATWIAVVTELVTLGLGLSPFRAVNRTGYTAGEAVLLVLALGVWLRRGRPLPAAPRLPRVADHPILVVLSVAVGISLAYELVLCITVAPNNWDSLTYHLSRAASWYQRERVGWIHDAPTERQNAFPANSELMLLWTFVAARSTRLAALPQFLAQAAMLVATYGIAVRLGFRRSSAAFAALLLATFALVALESTTTQNDLVLASLVAATVYFLLGAVPREGALAGLAFSLAIGTKLTAAVVLPALVLVGLMARPSRRVIAMTSAAAVAGFAALGSWLYVQNVEETGHLLGHGGGRVEHTPALTAIGWLATLIRVLYRFADFSGFEGTGPRYAVAASVLACSVLGAAALVRLDATARRNAPRSRVAALANVVPFVWPLLVLTGAMLAYGVLVGLHFPIDPSGTSEGAFSWRLTTRDQEDISYFGPVGAMVPVVAARMLGRGTWRTRPLCAAVATFFPLFLAGIALAYRFNAFVGRFMLLPVVVVAALLAVLYERRALAAGIAALAVATLALTHLNNELKPLRSVPWSISRAETLDLQVWQRGIGEGADALERAVPAGACIGAAMGGDDATFPLFGPQLRRRVSYVPIPRSGGLGSPGQDAVIFGPGESSLQPGADWRVSSLAGYWRLAVRKDVTRPFACRPGRSIAKRNG